MDNYKQQEVEIIRKNYQLTQANSYDLDKIPENKLKKIRQMVSLPKISYNAIQTKINPNLKNTYKKKTVLTEINRGNTLLQDRSIHDLQSIVTKSTSDLEKLGIFASARSMNPGEKSNIEDEYLIRGKEVTLKKRSDKDKRELEETDQAKKRHSHRTERLLNKPLKKSVFYQNKRSNTDTSEESVTERPLVGITNFHFRGNVPNFIELSKKVNTKNDENLRNNLLGKFTDLSYSRRQHDNNVFYKKNLENYNSSIKQPQLKNPMQTNDKKWLVCNNKNFSQVSESNPSIPVMRQYYGVDQKEELLEKVRTKRPPPHYLEYKSNIEGY